MSTNIGKIGSCCNNYSIQNGMFVSPYLSEDINAGQYLEPKIKPYSGWASYKNNKSGQFNRQLCWKCHDFKGYPQSPGLYNLDINDKPPILPNYRAMKKADIDYQIYQAKRLSINPGSYGSDYVNYFNTQCGFLYPKRYVKGNWPDEQLIYTNVPTKRSCKN